ncbi:tetratricopeptide repeat protein, partial [Candidatus Desantisbacteria bacterium]|nr:tetratricopeptide repeat protein [Candidatus Desantisbacteria bacterium]
MKHKLLIILVVFLFFNTTTFAEESIQSLLSKSEEYIKQNEFSRAIEVLQQILVIEPDNPEHINTLGSIYAKAGKFELAQEKFIQVIKMFPDFIKAYNNLGLVYIEQKKMMKGIESFEQGLKKAPAYNKMYSNLALAYYNLKMTYKAQETLERGEKNCPDDPEIIINLIAMYEETGRKNYIIKKYNELIQKYPDDLKILTGLSTFYMREERFENAVQILNKIISISPQYSKDERIYYLLGYCFYKQKKYYESENYLIKNLKKYPLDEETHYMLYSIYRDQNNIPKAEIEYQTIIKQNPAFDFSTNSFPLSKQIIEYSIFLKNDPQNIKNSSALMEVYYRIGLMDKALKTADSMIKKDPGNLQALIVKGLVNYRRGKLNESEKIFTDIVKIEPDNPVAKDILSKKTFPENLKQSFDNDIDLEREKLRSMIKADEKNPQLHFKYGNFFEKKGLNDYAILEYLDVILYDKNFITVYPALVDLYIRTGRLNDAFNLAKSMTDI